MKHLLIYTTLLLLMFAVSCKDKQHTQKAAHHKTGNVDVGCNCEHF